MSKTEGTEAKHVYVQKLNRHVGSLTGQDRGNLIPMSDAIVSLCEAMMFIMQVDYVTKDVCENHHKKVVAWRVIFRDIIVALGSIITLCYTAIKIMG